jgi:hypothetical protein
MTTKRQPAVPVQALLQYALLSPEDRRHFNAAINEFLLASPSGRRRLIEQWQTDFGRVDGTSQQQNEDK